jgi:hypothetical protein
MIVFGNQISSESMKLEPHPVVRVGLNNQVPQSLDSRQRSGS